MPSCPEPPFPKQKTRPSDVSAAEWWAPAATCTTQCPLSASTRWGNGMWSRMFRPVCPAWPLPKAYRPPFSASTSVWSVPQQTCCAGSPSRATTRAGKGEDMKCPRPSWPHFPRPQQYTRPSMPRAALWWAPAAICTTPAGMRRTTEVGTLRLWQSPRPSAPKVPWPNANTDELAARASVWHSPQATCTKRTSCAGERAPGMRGGGSPPPVSRVLASPPELPPAGGPSP